MRKGKASFPGIPLCGARLNVQPGAMMGRNALNYGNFVELTMEFLLIVGCFFVGCFLLSFFLIYGAVQIDVEEFPEKYRKGR